MALPANFVKTPKGVNPFPAKARTKGGKGAPVPMAAKNKNKKTRGSTMNGLCPICVKAGAKNCTH